MASMEFLIEGGVNVRVTVTEDDGNLVFNVHVLQPGEAGYTGQIGEINGLFFDLAADVSGYAAMTSTDSEGDTLFTAVDEGSISNLGGGVNINGEVLKEFGTFDVGVLLDPTGLGNGDLQDITFTLDADQALTLDDVALQNFAVRLTSVGDPDGSRTGSLKLGTTAPEEPDDEIEDPNDGGEGGGDGGDGSDGEEQSGNDAIDDFLTAKPDAIFGVVDEYFEIGSGPFSLLDNDVTDTGELYEGDVLAVNDETFMQTDDLDYVEVPGSHGGLLRVYENGTVDFSANGEFGEEEAETSFEYTIEGGDTATITVLVTPNAGDGGGGLDLPPFDDGGGDFFNLI